MVKSGLQMFLGALGVKPEMLEQVVQYVEALPAFVNQAAERAQEIAKHFDARLEAIEKQQQILALRQDAILQVLHDISSRLVVSELPDVTQRDETKHAVNGGL